MTTFPQRKGPTGPVNTTGGGVPPLSTVFYIDGNEGILERDGSISKPWISVQEAYDNLPGSGGDFTFLFTSCSAGALEIPPDDPRRSITFQAISAENDGTQVPSADMGPISVGAGSIVALSFVNMSVDGDIDSESDGPIIGTGTHFDGHIVASNTAKSVFNYCFLTGNVSSGLLRFTNCQFQSAITLESTNSESGSIELDGVSTYNANQQSVTITTDSNVLIDDTNAIAIVSDFGGTQQELLPVVTIAEGGLLVRETSVIRGKLGTTPGCILVWDGSVWQSISAGTVTGDTGGNAALQSLLSVLADMGIIINSTT